MIIKKIILYTVLKNQMMTWQTMIMMKMNMSNQSEYSMLCKYPASNFHLSTFNSYESDVKLEMIFILFQYKEEGEGWHSYRRLQDSSLFQL